MKKKKKYITRQGFNVEASLLLLLPIQNHHSLGDHFIVVNIWLKLLR